VSTFTWTNTAGGDWSAAADWSSSPTPTSDVAITLPGTYTVTTSVSEATQSVVVDAPGATLVLDASLTVANGFTLQAGTLVFAGGRLSAGTFEQDGGVITGTTINIVAIDSMALDGGVIGATGAVVLSAGVTTLLPATPVDSVIAVVETDGMSPAAVTDGLFMTDGRATVGPATGTEQTDFAPTEVVLTPLTDDGSATQAQIISVEAQNTLTWTNTAGGDWSTGSNWSGGVAPTAADDAVIVLPGTYTITQSGNSSVADVVLDDPAATLMVSGLLNAGTLTLDAGTLMLYGTLAGATVLATAAAFEQNYGSGTLSGVTWIGPFNVGGNWVIDAATQFQGPGDGPGTFDMQGAELTFAGPRTLDNLNIAVTAYYDEIGATTDTLTLGPTVFVTVSHAPSVFSAQLDFTGSVVNQGSVLATGTGDMVSLGSNFTNTGWIGIENGAALQVNAYGVLDGLVNNGTIALGDATTTLNLYGTETVGDLGTVTSAGGSIALWGVLDNTGGTLVLAPGSGFGNVAFGPYGVLQGGTVLDQGGTFDFAGGTLADLTWVGPMDLTGVTVMLDNVAVQAAEDGPGTVTLDNTNLYVTGAGTLDGMTLNASGNFDTVSDGPIYFPTAGTVTLGSTAVLNAVAGGTDVVLQAATAVVNDGTINVAGTGEILAVQAPNFINANLVNVASNGVFLAGATVAYPTIPPGAFENAGDIAIASDGTFDVGPNETSYTNLGTISFADPTSTLELNGTATATALGNFTGAGQLVVGGLLDNTGNTLDIGPAGSFDVLQLGAGDFAFPAGVVQGGTIAVQGGTAVFDSGTLDEVVWVGPLVIGGQSASNELLVENGFQVEPTGDGPRIVTLTGAGIAALDFVDSETLNNVSLTASAQINDVWSGATLTFDSATTIVVAPGTTEVLALNAVTLVNNGLITDTTATDSFVAVTGTSFANNGTIEVSGATNGLVVQPAAFLNAGQVSIADGATFYLDVPQQPIQTYSQTVGTFSNTGTIAIDATSTLILGGTLTQASFAEFATSGGLIELAGTLLNAGDTLQLAPHTQFGNLLLGETVPGGPSIFGAPAGTIQGGTVFDQGGSLTILSATLDGVTWQAPVDLTQAYARLEVVDGTTLEPLPGNSQTLINLTGLGSSIGFDAETLTDTTATMGAVGGGVTFGGPLTPLLVPVGPGGTIAPPPVLTLAAGTTLTAATPGAGVINLTGDITNQGLINDADGSVALGSFTPSYDFGGGGGVIIVDPYPTASPIFDNQGTVLAEAGDGSTFTIGDLTTLTNEGLVRIGNGDDLVVQTSTFDNTGTLAVGTGTIEFTATIANTGTIAFTPGDAGVVIFDMPDPDETGPIINLGTGDRIEFGDGIGVLAADVTAPGMVTVMTNIGSIVLSDLSFAGGPMQSFATGIDTATGDGFITPTGTLSAPCFAAGTRIATAHGEVAVETIQVGDTVRTLLGNALTPIIWVGHRKVDCARHPHPARVWPVRVAAGAFGSNRPHTDLFLSPDHSVYVNRVLIPIKHLINGSTITQVPTDQVTYHHLELPAHNVLLAEGLPAESFLDLRDGSDYASRPGPARLYPDFSARMWEAFGCARLVVTGPELRAARALVAGVASARAAA
jgi:hypothetical protein